MSVNIVPPVSAQSPSLLQRVFGAQPRTVVHETSTTTITQDPGGRFSLKAALRNGGIGAAVAGALGGVSLLGKVALPLVGKVGSVAGLAKLAGVGGAIGIAAAAIPLLAPKVQRSPAAKAALTGAAIGAAAGAVLPLLPIGIGAAVGAGVGLLIHRSRTNPRPEYAEYPGYSAYPGFVPAGPGAGAGYPGAFPTGGYGGVPMGYPGAGAYPGYGTGVVGPTTGFPAYAGYGVSMLPMTAGAAQGTAGAAPQLTAAYGASPVGATVAPARVGGVPSAAPAAARPAATKAPRFPGAKTWVDTAGNVREVGTGKVLKRAHATAPSATRAAPAGLGTSMPSAGLPDPVM